MYILITNDIKNKSNCNCKSTTELPITVLNTNIICLHLITVMDLSDHCGLQVSMS